MNLQAIIDQPAVRAALERLRERDPDTLDEQVRIAAIPAPTGLEAERGRYFHLRFQQLGLRDVRVDAVGNVLGCRPGASADPTCSASPIVIGAHLDTIFPPWTPVQPRRAGSRLLGPGITDNARGLAAMLAIVETLRESPIATRHPVHFAATVGEEGLGDLRGVKHLFQAGAPLRGAAAFIAVDGAGLGRIVNEAIGSCRLRVRIRGPGGHSWGDRRLPNPAHALGSAIERLSRIRPPGEGEYAVTVGRLGGGTSVNAIPSEAWLELDLRSGEVATLEYLERSAREVLEQAGRAERELRRQRSGLVVEIESIGSRPCGRTPAQSTLVRGALAATRLLGGMPELSASSTDANVPMAIGVPAIAIGAGGRAGGIHTADEWFDNQGGVRGIERALLALLAVAGVQGIDQGA